MNVQSELEAKEAAKAKREAQIKHDEFLENLKIITQFMATSVGFLVFAMASMAAITGMGALSMAYKGS